MDSEGTLPAMNVSPRRPLSEEQARRLDAYWRAANYLSVGQIFLRDNPLLREPLAPKHLKPRIIGHWGTTPGLNLVYAHANRLIVERELSAIFIAGPGHGGPGIVANTYLEGTYSELHPAVGRDAAGMKSLFKQFGFPGGIGSHAAADVPGSIHEGGELGYSIAHAYGAVFDNPGLLAVCVVGDGEAETGPLAASWHSNKFLNPARDGAVLPILHLNGYKIANPTVLARIPERELAALLRGYGYEPYLVSGDDPQEVHQALAGAMDACADEIADIQSRARRGGAVERPRWPMIVLRTPKGWTGPKVVNGEAVEGTFLAHSFRMAKMDASARAELLESWLRSYRPHELFDELGRPLPEIAELAPKGERRMSASPHANGGLLLRDLTLPDFRVHEVPVPSPGAVDAEATVVQGRYLREVLKANADRFRVFGPDEVSSNRWNAVFEVDKGCLVAEILAGDKQVSPDGRIMEVLSEHLCQGWLEGYLLTGRHGFFSCYEAFIRIVDSMASQHAKWIDVSRRIPWREPIAPLNYLLTSHVWRQDHNGFSHQEPGFIDHLLNKKSELIRVLLPPDANSLLWATDECLRGRNMINVVIAGKQVAPQWMTMTEAVKHCEAGVGVWDWAGSCAEEAPDVVMACCGDVPTMETLAAVEILLEHEPGLKIRVVNVVNLMKLLPRERHPQGLTDAEFDALFTVDKPVVFAFHGYPALIEGIVGRRTNGRNFQVRGFIEEGHTTTPFDIVVLNRADRWRLALDALGRVPYFAGRAPLLHQELGRRLAAHNLHVTEYGEDMPEIADWRWKGTGPSFRPLAPAVLAPVEDAPAPAAATAPVSAQ